MFASSSKHALSQCFRASKPTKLAEALSSAPATFLQNNSRRSNSTSSHAQRGDDQSTFRAGPLRNENSWKYDRQMFKRGSSTSEYNLTLRRLASGRKTAEVLEKAAEMKNHGIQPDSLTYSTILQALAGEGMYDVMWAVIREMQAIGIPPSVSHFNYLLSCTNNIANFYDVLNEMKKLNITPDERSFDTIIKFFVNGDNVELALCKISELPQNGLESNVRGVQMLIEALIQRFEARLALDVASAYEETAVRRLDNEIWVKLLGACSERLYSDGVIRCWAKVVDSLRIIPNEGLCQEVLHTAARHGLPALASSVLQQLEASGVKLQEYHFAPLIDAFARNGSLKEAFKVLELMRSSGVTATLNTALSVKKAVERDPDLIDAAYNLVEELQKEGETIDVIAVNILISACVFRKDIQRAVGIYKAMPSLGVQPDVETFESLLHCCERSNHIELAERLFSEIQSSNLKPSVKVFEWMILTAIEQDNYEDAFFYLEELKAAGFKPPYITYERIIRKCYSLKDTRYKLALDEMKQMGYRPLAVLQNFLDTDGKEWSVPAQSTRMPGRGKTTLS